MPHRDHLLAFIRSAYQQEHSRLDVEIEKWRGQFRSNLAYNALLGYSSPKWPLHLAAVAAFLHERSGDPELAAQAAGILLRYREWIAEMPNEAAAARPESAEGVPPLDGVFDPVVFAAACERLQPAIAAGDYRELAQIAADSLRLIWRFPEWGGHNRAMLRAASLATCGRAFADHPDAPAWNAMADELAEESWGRWSIEDAMMYQSHWVRALILYAEARGRAAELAEFSQPRMHLRAMPQLISPLGILPDFGDSHWLVHSPWEWLACLEWGARHYRDATMKWAAGCIWAERQPHETPNIYAAHVLTLAWRWCDDAMPAHFPSDTADALDDLVAKKIVFRTGWDPGATYACLNYRDEGDYGRIARDYLRTNLAVSAEKMHHGHADEGSISLLIHDGTILLHESGYREDPPDGVYRADIYHNRLVWRPGIVTGRGDPARSPAGAGGVDARPVPTCSVRDLMDNGHYKPVRTERLYQTRLGDAQISRVRMGDEREGIAWDRTIFFLRELPCWVVVDAAVALRAGPRTFGLLWWTTDVLAQGPAWSDTHIRRIRAWENRRAAALRIITPEIPGQTIITAQETLRRCFQDEIALASLWRGHHEAGRAVNFVTALWPHPYSSPARASPPTEPAPAPQVEVLSSDPPGRGIAVRLTWGGETRLLATLNDLGASWLQDEVRPRYAFEQGKTAYGALVTDAALAYLRSSDRVWAGFVNGTRLDYEGAALYCSPLNAMFQEDRTDRPGAAARFRWQSDEPTIAPRATFAG
ncbi:MAG: hypothetical protein FJ011_06805 [Chloroflexi bacterium]|nr:hypothetical protein [Chloroflexota bacterium]